MHKVTKSIMDYNGISTTVTEVHITDEELCTLLHIDTNILSVRRLPLGVFRIMVMK